MEGKEEGIFQMNRTGPTGRGGQEALQLVDLVSDEAGVEEREDGGDVRIVVEVYVHVHPPHHPQRRRAARRQPEHPIPYPPLW